MAALVLSSVEAVGVRQAVADGKQVYTYTIDGEPCPRCLGKCWVPGDPQGLDYGYHPSERKPCPKCDSAGRVVPERYRAVEGEVVELTAEGPGCRGAGFHGDTTPTGALVPLTACESTTCSGRVSLGRATIRVWPVIVESEWAHWEFDQWPNYPCVIVTPDDEDEPPFFYTPADGMTETVCGLDPLPVPGQFVVVVEFKDNP